MKGRIVPLLMGAAAAACAGTFDHVNWTTLAALPPGAVLESHHVVVPIGISVGARATAIDGWGDEVDCPVGMTSADPGVLRIDDTKRGTPVLSGMSVGATHIVLACYGETVDVPVDVTAP